MDAGTGFFPQMAAGAPLLDPAITTDRFGSKERRPKEVAGKEAPVFL
jgi:hypothetical protein